MDKDPKTAKEQIKEDNDLNRIAYFQFTPDFFKIKTIGTTLTFGVGEKPIKNFLMIERSIFCY